MQNDNELYHYGRLGMKWGQHIYKDRYGGLNKSGKVKVRQLAAEHRKLSNISTPTKAGVKRKDDIEKEYEHLTGKPIGTHGLKDFVAEKSKSVREMTNDELKAYNDRKALENTYLGYQPKPRISKGRQFAGFVGKKVIIPVAIASGQAYLTRLGVEAASKRDMGKATETAAKDAKTAAGKAFEKAIGGGDSKKKK